MGKKDNFNEAVYSMFGVGKAPAENEGKEKAEKAPETVEDLLTEYVKPQPAKEEPKVGTTVIAEGTSVEGKITSRGNVEIAGHFKGDIDAKGCVTISSNYQGNITASDLLVKRCIVTGDLKISGKMNLDEFSSIVGNVAAKELTCCGNVKGDLDIAGTLVLKEKAQIEGNIIVGSLIVEQGAVMQGSVTTKKK